MTWDIYIYIYLLYKEKVSFFNVSASRKTAKPSATKFCIRIRSGPGSVFMYFFSLKTRSAYIMKHCAYIKPAEYRRILPGITGYKRLVHIYIYNIYVCN